jgi:hypothetical protein
LFVLFVQQDTAAGLASEPTAWVDSRSGKIDCKSVNFGISRLSLSMQNDEKITIPIDHQCLFHQRQGIQQTHALQERKTNKSNGFMELVKSQVT